MFSRNRKRLILLAVLSVLSNAGSVYAEDASVAPISASSLPINVAEQGKKAENTDTDKVSGALVSPSQAQAVAVVKEESKPAQVSSAVEVKSDAAKPVTTEPAAVKAAEPKEEKKVDVAAPSPATEPSKTDTVVKPENNSAENSKQPQAVSASAKDTEPVLGTNKNDFDFDLKMKSIDSVSEQASAPKGQKDISSINDADLPKDIQYKVNPMENLGNSVLSQMDSDLFTQMSEIEKSTTLLTLELRREKIRNEIEAQKAIRQKNADDLERQKAEAELKNLEKKKQIEAQVLKEKQLLVDKEKLVEVLRQRKLLNAYMNQMLITQQEWLKEKEALYEQLAAAEQEKKELIELFKQKIGKVLEASAKNIQTAEAAKANFERIVKGLKARNEQLRKRIEADAQIIKNAKSSLYLKSQSIEELKDKNASLTNAARASASAAIEAAVSEPVEETAEETFKRLSAEYAILGIAGRAGVMSVDVIDAKGVPMSLKVGSPLPTGHVVSEIGADYVKFSRDGRDDYLYVGKTIDGVVPTLGLNTDKKNK